MCPYPHYFKTSLGLDPILIFTFCKLNGFPAFSLAAGGEKDFSRGKRAEGRGQRAGE
jgi:hypothetical protein